jgi:hypothetical protein
MMMIIIVIAILILFSTLIYIEYNENRKYGVFEGIYDIERGMINK